MLKKELEIFTFGDLLNHFPNRHIDKTQIGKIGEIRPETEFIQVVGTLMYLDTIGEKRGRRLVAQLKDDTGILELAWFQGITWVQKNLVPGTKYLVLAVQAFLMASPRLFILKLNPLFPPKQVARHF